jgi:hypothetical protein
MYCEAVLLTRRKAVYTTITDLYYIGAYHFFTEAYSCWAWLMLCTWKFIIWVSFWFDVTLHAGVMGTGNDEGEKSHR